MGLIFNAVLSLTAGGILGLAVAGFGAPLGAVVAVGSIVSGVSMYKIMTGAWLATW